MLLTQSLIAFAITMAFAYVVGGWTESMKAASAANKEDGEEEPAMVSLVVPARDAGDTLVPLLQDLYAQQWPKELMEVLVVDDGSTDNTASIVQGMARNWAGLRLVRSDGEGKKAAITRGVAEAAGEWIILTDADASCGPLRVRHAMRAIRGRRPDLLLMPVVTSGDGWIARLQVEEQAALMGVAAGTALQGRPVLANGANMAFRKEAFRAVGGYQGDRWASGDDLFLLRRMRRHHRRVDYLLDPEAAVCVQAEATVGGFWRQRLRWAGKMRAIGLGAWLPLAGLLLPWFLLYITSSITVVGLMGQRPLAVLLFLGSAWLLWLLPILRMVRHVHRFWRTVPCSVDRTGHPLPTFLALVAFSCYAPLVALASLVWRPTWKGRRI